MRRVIIILALILAGCGEIQEPELREGLKKVDGKNAVPIRPTVEPTQDDVETYPLDFNLQDQKSDGSYRLALPQFE